MKSHDDMCQVHMNSNNDMILLPAMTAGTVESLYNVCYSDWKCQKPNVKVKIMLFGIKGILMKASSVQHVQTVIECVCVLLRNITSGNAVRLNI